MLKIALFADKGASLRRLYRTDSKTHLLKKYLARADLCKSCEVERMTAVTQIYKYVIHVAHPG